MIFLLVICPSAWLLGRELKAINHILGIGKEARIVAWMARVDRTEDSWMKWKYCRKVLALDPENLQARFWKGRIANEYARKARDLMSAGRTPEAVSTLVLAVRVDPQVGYFWVWLEDWIETWTGKNRDPQAASAASGPRK